MSVIPSGQHIVEFLASRPEFVGVGKATAARLWKAFRTDLYAILGNGDIDRLAEILNRNQASIVIDAWRNQIALTDCVVFFDEHGIDPAVARKAIDFWGDKALSKIRDNPYRLLSVCSWRQVDRVGGRIGISPDDIRRKIAAVESVLYERIDGKHTWCGRQTLLEQAGRRLGVDFSGAEDAIEAAVADGAAIFVDGGYQPAGAAYMERFIEDQIRTRVERSHPNDLFLDGISPLDVTAFLRGFALSGNLTTEQHEAVRMVVLNQFSLLIGGAGVGKTTTLKAINAACRHFGMTVYMLAVAGRAAKRIAETTGQPAQTIASWLRAVANGWVKLGRHCLVIIDEASMLDLPTFYRILYFLPEDARCLLVGDTAQLPPIGFGLTLHQLVRETQIPKTELTRILRTSEGSDISRASVAVRNGKMPDLPNYTLGKLGCSLFEAAPKNVIHAIEDVLHDLRDEEVQVLGSAYAGPSGIDAINAYFHNLRAATGVRTMLGFAKGDPCIWTVNDYDRKLWNGSMGHIVAFDGDSVFVDFDDGRHRIGPNEIEKLALAYCVSVHKSQGSQFRNVVMTVQSTRNMDRAMFYTAITRAVDRVIVVGQRPDIANAVEAHPHSFDRRVALRLRHH